jgi:hypothetical protein
LEPLRRLKLIEAWHDRKIKPGEEWDKSISINLEKADIILLLISIDFINSSFCYDIELERAIERQATKEAEVIPIILRNCMWQQTSFGKLQALPKDARPVSLWADRDDALVNVADGMMVSDKLQNSFWHLDRRIGIRGRVTRPPVPHHSTCGFAYGGSTRLNYPFSCGRASESK